MSDHEHYDEADLAAITASIAPAYGWRGDAGEAVFFARQLDYVKARVYNAKYPAPAAGLLVPRTSELPAWAESGVYRTYDQVGYAKVIANYADDLPRVDVFGREAGFTVKTVGDSYGYNKAEIRASQATGANLDGRRAAAASRAVDLKLNRVALVGDADFGLLGILTHPNIGTAVITGGWATTAGSVIYDDLMIIYNAVVNQSLQQHRPTGMVMTPTALSRAFSTRMSSDDTRSPGEAFLSVVRGPFGNAGFNLASAIELVGAGTSGADLVFCGEINSENASHEVPQDFEPEPPQLRNLETIINCTARTAGVQVYYPLAFIKVSGT
ncbi:MAG: hypothetical protein JWP29_3553 [Rhodoferax sp.]|nr:hypothetical protein [Rhodoferax sp.]